MLSLVTAAEQQYRHDAQSRDRELALRASIRERRAAEAAEATALAGIAAARQRRAAWARPIGARLAQTDPCPTAGAVA